MQKQNTRKIFLFIILIFAIIILFGIGLGFLYSALPSHTSPKDEQGCERVGGQWTDDQTCLLSYKRPVKYVQMEGNA